MSAPQAPTSAGRPKGVLPPFAAILLAFALFAGLVAWILHVAGPVEDVEAKRAAERLEFLHKSRARDAEALNSYGPADPASGLARIPANRAAELAVDRLKAKPVRPADLIPPPPPAAPTNAPAAVSAPAPAAPAKAPAAAPAAKPPKA